MITIYDLNKDIIAHILFYYLDIHNIINCYLSSKIFHCLNNKQLDIIVKAKKGWLYNIKEDNLKVCQWMYYSSLRCGEYVNRDIFHTYKNLSGQEFPVCRINTKFIKNGLIGEFGE